MNEFPEYACDYARKLAGRSARFALQVFARGEENGREGGEYGPDPFGETLERPDLPYALKQRFPDRVLVMTSGRCFMNCRHCTRRGILDSAQVVETDAQLAACVEFVNTHPLVRDVLLSGGDILTLPDERVMWFVDAFAALDQIDIVRVCTRAPCVNPSRITYELAKRLGASKKVWVNTQFNCADELTAEAKEAVGKLVEAGIPVGCQTVLLKGVNDTAEDMLRLFKALSAARIRPYYVFMCDPVAGIERFRVDLETAKAIERQCAESIGGLSMPRFVADIPGSKRKVPISELRQMEV